MLLHIVKQGECLSSIAAKYRFSDWHTIYDDAANAEFRAKRPDPNLIYPNDELFIPDWKPGEKERPTDARHRFTVKTAKSYLNVRILDSDMQPIGNAAYKLELEGKEYFGNTDADGWIKTEIPAIAEFGTLTIQPDPDNEDIAIRWSVRLGHLDPLETTTGVKARLNNLGYDCGEINDEEDERYDAAVREFQSDQDLVVDGIVGPKTRGKLKQDHQI